MQNQQSNAHDRPHLLTAVPGPRSRELARRLAAVESPNVTFAPPDGSWPVFLARGDGAFIHDADGNRLLDATGCFAVASLGHGASAATDAGAGQLARLSAGLGDVHPTEAKVELLERLARLAPFPDARVILGVNGSDAVESAIKTAKLTTGRPGIISFTGGYHGLGYGALAATAWGMFRQPFDDQLADIAHVACYPDPYRRGGRATDYAIDNVNEILDSPVGRSIGAVIVEPIQGRGGDVVPPDDFLPRLRQLCDERGLLLVFDEIYTGLARTGRLWACGHTDTAPDILLAGKALGGGFPISACICNARAIAGWPASTGEALHTWTALGHPVGCAMACAAIDRILADDLPARAAALGEFLLARLRDTLGQHPAVGEIRGRGLMVGVELVLDRESKRPAGALAAEVATRCLAEGLLILPSGVAGNVLSFAPVLTINEGQLATAVEIVGEAMNEQG